MLRVHTQVVTAFAHQHMPFALLVQKLQPERDASRASPYFDVAFAFQREQDEQHGPSLQYKRVLEYLSRYGIR